jgi:glycosyltransferase involved in cell wall biosynthesis|tara:strand:+ start:38396 stop:39367 length:972 start_codon:yes stop_codon:yes gene_type:complete
MPTVAIVTPVYATPENDRLKYFRHTVNSVLRQNHRNIVHIVVDDGSTVDVASFLQDYHDPRIRYLKREKSVDDLRTASNALNMGIDYCLVKDGNIFAANETRDLTAVTFVHSDDLLTEDSIAMRVSGLPSGFIFTDMGQFNNGGRRIQIKKGSAKSVGDRTYALRNPMAFNHHTIMWNLPFLHYLKEFVARKYDQQGVFDSKLFHGEDRDMSLSSSEAAIEGGFEVAYVPLISVMYRQHSLSISGEVDPEQLAIQHDLNSMKHFGSPQQDRSLERMLSNLPWSLGAFLPKEIKQRIRPIKDLVEDVRLHVTKPHLYIRLVKQI